MNARRALAASLLAGTAVAACIASPALAQSTASHEVRRGDSLFGVTRKTKHDGVSRNQMLLAIWRANQGAFPGGNINLLEVGTVLNIPSRDAVAAIESTEADRLVREMLAKSAPPAQMAAIPPAKPAAVPPAREQAVRRYQEGLTLERRGDNKGALTAFLEAGEAGYGLAQRRLGQIYDSGNPDVPRDFQASVKWYQKAREQGVEIDKPLPRMTTK